jgi:hypothetical protein
MGSLVDWTSEKRISGLEDKSIETFPNEKQRGKKKNFLKWNKTSKNCGTITKGIADILWNTKERKVLNKLGAYGSHL